MSKSVTIALAAFISGVGCATAVSQMRDDVVQQFIKNGEMLNQQVTLHGQRVLSVDGPVIRLYVGKLAGECVPPPDPTIWKDGIAALVAQQEHGSNLQVIGDTNCRPK